MWISEEGGRNGCSCRVFLDEGTCGHIDAAVSAAKEQGILETKVRFTSTAAERGLAALGSPSTQVRPTSTGASCLPFDAIAKKARGLVVAKKEEKKGEETGCFGGITSKATPPAETLAIKDAPAVIIDAEKSGNCSVLELDYLEGKEALSRIMVIINGADRTAEIRLRAYSFDQPDVIQAAQSALSRGAKLWVIVDGSQSRGGTKQQLQSLKMLRESGGNVRICCVANIGQAYEEDGRDVKIGGKLRSKTVLVRFFPDLRKAPPRVTPSTQCVIGSCNFTTSSKANAESGAFLRLNRGSSFERDWIHAFEARYSSGEDIEEFESRVEASKKSSFRRSPTVERE